MALMILLPVLLALCFGGFWVAIYLNNSTNFINERFLRAGLVASAGFAIIVVVIILRYYNYE